MAPTLRYAPAFALLACLALPGTVRAETVNCTPITALPFEAASPGVYCMTKDLATAMTNGQAIRIVADNVTIDCNGYKLGGLAGGPDALTYGVAVQSVRNATVRNCNVRGFYVGVHMEGDGSALLDSRLEGATWSGARLIGSGLLVRGNLVRGVTSGTYAYGAIGISTEGNGDVIDNTVEDIVAKPGSGLVAYGIVFDDRNGVAEGGSIVGNRIRRIESDGISDYPINATQSSHVSIRGNTITGPMLTHGIHCTAGNKTIASENHLLGTSYAMNGCIDGGGNLVQ